MAEFKLTASNVRKGMNALGEKVGGVKRKRIVAVMGHPLAFAAFHARIKLKARGQKFGTFQDFLNWLIENQDEIISFITKIIALFGMMVAIGFILALLAMPASAAVADDCKCGPNCPCKAPAASPDPVVAKVNVVTLRAGQARRLDRQAKRQAKK